MTDKQIIIDGVDVSGCLVFNNKFGIPLCNHLDDIREAIHCSDNPNCLYKKYKRKEKECEELKEEFKLFQQLKDEDSFRVVELSTENVKLKHQLDLYKNTHKTEQNRRRAFEQTLAEIKEIIKQGVKIHDDIIVSKQILQKINEVTDEPSL